MRERLRSGLAYVLIILVGLACIVLISLSAVGRQGIGWLVGADLLSNLPVDYDIQITVTLPAIDATEVAEIQATDEAALRITPDPASIVTVPAGRFTPGATRVAQVTATPTATPTPLPTHTFTPAPSSTPTPTFQPTRTPTLPPTSTPTPTVPTSTSTPMSTPTDTPTTPAPTTPAPTTPAPTTPAPTTPAPTTPAPTTPAPTTPAPTTPAPTTNPPPPPPLSLTVVNTSITLISLAWSNESASDADFVEYRVYRSTTTGGPYTLIASTGTTTAFVDSGLTTGTPYYYVVRGADAIQESANSPEASGVPSAISNPNPTPDCSAPLAPPDCVNASTPDGNPANVGPGQELILDLGPGNGILDGPGYDFVYYEIEATPPPSYRIIQMDWVTVELSIDNNTWYTAFVWGTGNEAQALNSNVAPYAYTPGTNPGAYCDLLPGAEANELIPMLPQGEGFCTDWSGLWVTPPGPQTGIAIDISSVIPPPTGEGYRYIRIRARGPQPAQLDGIERLN